MGVPATAVCPQPPSALQTFLAAHPSPHRNAVSTELHNLALQIAFTLRYEHRWADVYLHYPMSSPSARAESRSEASSHRPLLSGIPPRRIYMHPDEQIEILQQQKESMQSKRKEAGKNDTTAVPLLSPPVPASEREWVLPSHLRERWTLRKFGDTFDVVAAVVEDSIKTEETTTLRLFGDDEEQDTLEAEAVVNPWRRKLPKRLLLGTLDDDSTVVFYVVHDGIVKPRQN